MSALDVVLVVAVSGVTSFLVSIRGQLRLLLPLPRPRPVDPDVMEGIMRNAMHLAYDPSAMHVARDGTPPSAPRPPLP